MCFWVALAQIIKDLPSHIFFLLWPIVYIFQEWSEKNGGKTIDHSIDQEEIQPTMIRFRKTSPSILRLYFCHLFTIISSKTKDWKSDFTMTTLAKISKALNSFARMPWDTYWQKLPMVRENLKNQTTWCLCIYTNKHTHTHICTHTCIFKDSVSLTLILLPHSCQLRALILLSLHFPKVLSNHWSRDKEVRGWILFDLYYCSLPIPRENAENSQTSLQIECQSCKCYFHL